MSINDSTGRRRFITNLATIAGGSILMTSPRFSFAAEKNWTIGEIMDLFIAEVKGAPFPQTVDTLKSGSRDTQVTGIVTSMFATIPVIEQTAKLGANFIIAHEPSFYNHLDNTDWLADNEVFNYKKRLLDQHKIAIWRNHDYIHSHRPDGVFSGVLEKLGWSNYTTADSPWNVKLPKTTLSHLIREVKDKLAIKQVRYIGDEDQVCSNVLLMPGAAGGQRQIAAIEQQKPDVAIVGELQEWETAEFVRDARAMGKKLSLIVLGHTDSEDGGSIYMKEWLEKTVPGIKVTHIHSGNPFSFQ